MTGCGRARNRKVGGDQFGRGRIAGASRPGTPTLYLGGGLFGLCVAPKAFAVGLAADAISLGILDARGMTGDPDAEVEAEVQCLFVGETELACQLIYANLLGQVLRQSLLAATPTAPPLSILARSSTVSRSAITVSRATGTRKARLKACRCAACSRHRSAGNPATSPPQSHAPRPESRRERHNAPPASRATRTISVLALTDRHPIQVRIGGLPSRPGFPGRAGGPTVSPPQPAPGPARPRPQPPQWRRHL